MQQASTFSPLELMRSVLTRTVIDLDRMTVHQTPALMHEFQSLRNDFMAQESRHRVSLDLTGESPGSQTLNTFEMFEFDNASIESRLRAGPVASELVKNVLRMVYNIPYSMRSLFLKEWVHNLELKAIMMLRFIESAQFVSVEAAGLIYSETGDVSAIACPTKRMVYVDSVELRPMLPGHQIHPQTHYVHDKTAEYRRLARRQ
jgi:hypothetical protein